jgi:Tfp pilus assembly protein PilX
MEFKYLALADLNLTGEQVRAQSREESRAIPAVQAALREASEQLQHYQQVLIDKYHEPQRLRCLAVVALGFDRLVWEMLPVN